MIANEGMDTQGQTNWRSELSPKLASQDAAAQLVALLCSASREIGLKEHVCSPSKRPELLKWMKNQCKARRVWTLAEGATLVGMLILKENAAGILYVVVAESFRRRGLGPALIRHIQSLVRSRFLRRLEMKTRGECLSAAHSVPPARCRLPAIRYCRGDAEKAHKKRPLKTAGR